MNTCFFVSDLHGRLDRYEKLFLKIKEEFPGAVFLGGDLFPSGLASAADMKLSTEQFLKEIVAKGLKALRASMKDKYPTVFMILGNDDGRFEEQEIIELEKQGIWHYAHGKRVQWEGYSIYGYSCVPPTPFMLKDWERYDVSRFVDPGCVPPEEGWHSIKIDEFQAKHSTIQADLEKLAMDDDMSRAIFLFHSPPYQTKLDRAALDRKSIDYVSLDVHVGSIAIRRFIESRQPLLTLHGHVHESARITGSWKDQIGDCSMFSAAHDGPGLALVKFNLENLDDAERTLI